MNPNILKSKNKKKRGLSLKSWIYNGKKLQKSFESVIKNSFSGGEILLFTEVITILGKIKNNTVLEKREETLLNNLLNNELFEENFKEVNPNISFSQLKYFLQELITNNKLIETLDLVESENAFSFEQDGRKRYLRVLESFGEIELTQNIKTGKYIIFKNREEILYDLKMKLPKINGSVNGNYLIFSIFGKNNKTAKNIIFSREGNYIEVKGKLYYKNLGQKKYFIDKDNSSLFRLDSFTGDFRSLVSKEYGEIHSIFGQFILFTDEDFNNKLYDISKEKFIIENIDSTNKSLNFNNTQDYDELFFLSNDGKKLYAIHKITGEIKIKNMEFSSLGEAIEDYYLPYEDYYDEEEKLNK